MAIDLEAIKARLAAIAVERATYGNIAYADDYVAFCNHAPADIDALIAEVELLRKNLALDPNWRDPEFP